MWLKIKVWTKVVVGCALGLYVLLFIYNNSGQPVQFWWWFNHTQPASVFTLSSLAFVAGILAAVLVRTTWITYSQFRELQRRSRSQKMERDLADMKSKAAMLKTRGALSSPVSVPAETIDDDLPPE
ncbi:hypothetical protein BH09PLA1_BH09PLA1_22350 [soil metagenome]